MSNVRNSKRSQIGVWLFTLGLFLLWAAPMWGGYWSHQTRKVKGKHVFLEELGIRYRYVRITPTTDAQITLKTSKSVQFRFFPEEDGTLRIRLIRGNRTLRMWKLLGRPKVVKTFLEKGTYRLKATGRVRFRYYEWKNVQLKGVPPVGGGYPVTLLVKNKKYAYYRAHGDTTVAVKVKGKATLWLYVRTGIPPGRRKAEVEIEIFRDGKSVKTLQVRLTRSKTAQFQDLPLHPSRALKIKFRVPSGVHEYRVRIRKGTGFVKFYIERRMREPEKRSSLQRTLKRLHGIGSLAPVPWSTLLISRPPSFFSRHRSMKFRLRLETSVSYESNPWKFSQPDVQKVLDHVFPYTQLRIAQVHDIRWTTRMTWQLTTPWGTWSLPVQTVGYETFQTRNFFQGSLRYTSPRIGRRWVFQGGGSMSSPKYLRPVRWSGEDVAGFFPLQYSTKSLEIGIESRWFPTRARPRVEIRWMGTAYRYHSPFEDLSGFWSRFRVKLLTAFGPLAFSVYREWGRYSVDGWTPQDLGYAHDTRTWGGRVQWVQGNFRPYVWGRYRTRIFLTPRESDVLHFGRQDREILLTVGLPFRFRNPWLEEVEVFVSRETRKVRFRHPTTFSLSRAVFREYKNIVFGIRWSWKQDWRWRS